MVYLKDMATATVMRWLRARTVKTAGGSVRAAKLFADYRSWCDEQEIPEARRVGSRTFGMEVNTHFWRLRDMQGNVYAGIELLPKVPTRRTWCGSEGVCPLMDVFQRMTSGMCERLRGEAEVAEGEHRCHGS